MIDELTHSTTIRMTLFRSARTATALLATAAALGAFSDRLVAQAAAPAATSARPAAAVESITARDIYRRVAFLASDEMRGRDTPSPALDSTASYLAAEYRRMGLRPTGDSGSFLQSYALRTVALDTGSVHFGHLLADGSGNQMLRYGTDFFALPGGTREGLDMNHARLVYVGALGAGGLPAGEYTGAVAIVSIPGPFGRAWQQELARARAAAQEVGATALGVVASDAVGDEVFARLAEASRTAQRLVVGELPPDELAVFVFTRDAFGAIAAREGAAVQGDPDAPVPFRRVEAHFAATLQVVDEAFAPNVAAVLPGSDPELSDEFVVLSAHMDHVGVGDPVDGDSIYNGADDDASGTSALLEVAEAMTMLPRAPRRSVLFLHVSGEEAGLLGSRYFAEHPTVPIESIVANVNVDMIGRNSPDSVVVIGKEYSSLGDLADVVQQRHPELGLTLADDIWPEERFFFRSDHFHFARKEIPALFFFSGVHEDYHQPSDEVDKLDVDKAARISRMIFHLVREIADARQRPQWDPKGLAEVRRMVGS